MKIIDLETRTQCKGIKAMRKLAKLFMPAMTLPRDCSVAQLSIMLRCTAPECSCEGQNGLLLSDAGNHDDLVLTGTCMAHCVTLGIDGTNGPPDAS